MLSCHVYFPENTLYSRKRQRSPLSFVSNSEMGQRRKQQTARYIIKETKRYCTFFRESQFSFDHITCSTSSSSSSSSCLSPAPPSAAAGPSPPPPETSRPQTTRATTPPTTTASGTSPWRRGPGSSSSSWTGKWRRAIFLFLKNPIIFFSFFIRQFKGPSTCPYDYLEVRSGGDGSSPRVGRWCGDNCAGPGTFTTSSNKVWKLLLGVRM